MFDVISTITLHDALLIAHIVGLVMGFGVAISIDYLLLRALLSRRLSPIVMDIAMHAAKLTTFGLVVLWISGIGFLMEYNALNPDKLANPKIHAKVVIVLILTLNGALIHRFVLPILWHYTGRDVLKMASNKTLMLFGACATVSTISWVFPIIFGLNKALNFNYSAVTLLSQYLMCIALVIALVFSALYLWRAKLLEPEQSRVSA